MRSNPLEVLYNNRNMANYDEQLRFIEAVKHLKPRDTTLLPDLFYLFYDNDEEDTALQYLASYIDGFDLELVIQHLVQVTPALIGTAHDWLTSFYFIGLSQTEFIEVWKNAVNSLPKNDIAVIRALFAEIKDKTEKMMSVTQHGIEFNERVLVSIKQLSE